MIIKDGDTAFIYFIDKHRLKESDFYMKTYKDSEGREWGKVGYYADVGGGSYVSGWVCLGDPGNSDIPAFNPAPKPKKWSPDDIVKYSLRGITGDYNVFYLLSSSVSMFIIILAAVLTFGMTALT